MPLYKLLVVLFDQRHFTHFTYIFIMYFKLVSNSRILANVLVLCIYSVLVQFFSDQTTALVTRVNERGDEAPMCRCQGLKAVLKISVLRTVLKEVKLVAEGG